MFEVVLILFVVAVVAGLRYVWRNRNSKIARGIGAAGIAYNDIYGQGRPPQVPIPVESEADPQREDRSGF